MNIEDYKRLLAIEEVNTFFTKIYVCWEELENKNEANKESAIKNNKETFTKLEEILKQKSAIISEMKIFDYDIHFNSFIGSDFFGICYSVDEHKMVFYEEDLEFIKLYVSKNKSSNIPIELQSPAEIRYIETVKELKKLKRKEKTSKMKRKFYDKMDTLSNGNYFLDKWSEECDNITNFSDKSRQILSDQRKMEFFKALTFEQYNAFLECYDCFCECNTSYEEYKTTESELNKTMYISEKDMYGVVLSELLEKQIITEKEITDVKFHLLNFMFFKDESLIFPNQVIKDIPFKLRYIIDTFITSQGLDSYSSVFAREVYNASVENKDKILSKVLFKN